MLAAFFSEDGRILFTYPEVTFLCKGDTVAFKEKEYVVARKRFDVDAAAMEFFLQAVETLPNGGE